MCRYGETTYKEPFACFCCRKVFKKTSRWHLPKPLRNGQERIVLCPQCGKGMADIGFDFKAPKQKDKNQWKKVRVLFENGFNFYSCGCCGPGYRPKELREVYDFIESNREISEGEKLVMKMALLSFVWLRAWLSGRESCLRRPLTRVGGAVLGAF